MNCRTFRKRHVAFVDDTVCGAELVELRQHLSECGRCSRLDAKVRRALILAHNLPSIEPSSDFAERLRVRLRFAALRPEIPRSYAASRLAAAAVILLTVGYGVREYVTRDDTPLAHAPVVATAALPEVASSAFAEAAFSAPAIVASLSTGLALWPAALVADQAPAYFVNAAFEGR